MLPTSEVSLQIWRVGPSDGGRILASEVFQFLEGNLEGMAFEVREDPSFGGFPLLLLEGRSHFVVVWYMCRSLNFCSSH